MRTDLNVITVQFSAEQIFSGALYVPAAEIVRAKVCTPLPLALLARNVTEKLPLSVGVPEINPLVPLMVKPAGKPFSPKLVGWLVAVI
jgi:hypothetical protein